MDRFGGQAAASSIGSYPRDAEAPSVDNLTSKASRILGLVRSAEAVLERIENTVIRPETANQIGKAPGPQPPDPAHVVFTLEASEQGLNELIGRLNRVANLV